MKVFISADMEGICSTSFWNDCVPGERDYKMHADAMTKEVIAACEGAFLAGATEIVVRDAHHDANNININELPSGVKLIRGWSGHPFLMVEGINETYDAAMYIGYHSAASNPGNPLSHTENRKIAYVKINGKLASEFMIFSYAAASIGVPSVFLSGDKELCDDSKELHPKLITYPTKEGWGSATFNYNVKDTIESIKRGVAEALRQDLSNSLLSLPNHFELEVCYKEHTDASKFSYYPGVEKIDNNTLIFRTDDYFELLRTFRFIS